MSALGNYNNLYYSACATGKQVLNDPNWKHVHTKTCTWMLMAALFKIVKNVETTQMSIEWWTEKNVVYAYNVILFRCKK